MPWPANQARARSKNAVTVAAFSSAEQLAVGQARVVVDDRVEVVVAERVGLLPRRCVRAIAGDRVPGPAKARVALDVHVQQIAGARPLIADDLLARAAAARREQPWRLQDRVIVECATPVSATSSRGPQPVRLRASQTRRSTSAGVWRGERARAAGAIQRPRTRLASSCGGGLLPALLPPPAVPGATERAAAAALSVNPSSSCNRASSARPAGPSLPLTC